MSLSQFSSPRLVSPPVRNHNDLSRLSRDDVLHSVDRTDHDRGALVQPGQRIYAITERDIAFVRTRQETVQVGDSLEGVTLTLVPTEAVGEDAGGGGEDRVDQVAHETNMCRQTLLVKIVEAGFRVDVPSDPQFQRLVEDTACDTLRLVLQRSSSGS